MIIDKVYACKKNPLSKKNPLILYHIKNTNKYLFHKGFQTMELCSEFYKDYEEITNKFVIHELIKLHNKMNDDLQEEMYLTNFIGEPVKSEILQAIGDSIIDMKESGYEFYV